MLANRRRTAEKIPSIKEGLLKKIIVKARTIEATS
jgi:hypothetical protein